MGGAARGWYDGLAIVASVIPAGIVIGYTAGRILNGGG